MSKRGASEPGSPPEVLLGPAALGRTVERLAREIVADHPDGLVLVGVLKGALLFVADLVRAVGQLAEPGTVEVDFLAISRFAPDSGRVRILKDLDVAVGGRDVVVVEDLVDTGLTLARLLGELRARQPRHLSTCTLVDRPGRRIVPESPRYVGVEVAPDAFVLGYGLHHADLYRNVPGVVLADRARVHAEPEAYVAWCYGEDAATRW